MTRTARNYRRFVLRVNAGSGNVKPKFETKIFMDNFRGKQNKFLIKLYEHWFLGKG